MPSAAPLPEHPDVAVESDETVWNGRFPLQRIRFRQRRFDGAMSGLRTWELWRRGRAAALLPYDPVADVVLLIEQFRLPAFAAGIEPVLVEFPAGLCDPGETAQATLLREADEELGVPPRRLERIGEFLLSPGGCDEFVAVFAGEVTAPEGDAEGIVGSGGLEDEHEDIRIRRWPAAEAIAAAQQGRMTNAITALGLFWLGLNRERLRNEWATP
jgi:ADP-ribose pyrophosphatase